MFVEKWVTCFLLNSVTVMVPSVCITEKEKAKARYTGKVPIAFIFFSFSMDRNF